MSLKPFYKLDGFPEALLAVVMGVAVWGSYGFPHFTEVALGCIALGCIGAFMWKRSNTSAEMRGRLSWRPLSTATTQGCPC
jgi:hypothetical protein